LERRLASSHHGRTGKRFYLHVTSRSIPLPNHKVTTRPVIPSHIEVAASIVVEVNVGEVVGPVLDCVDAILAGLKSTFDRSCNSHIGDSRKNPAGKSERSHVGKFSKKARMVRRA